MNELLKFIRKYSSWLLFAVYAVASCIMLFSTNPYQHHVFLSSASTVASGVYSLVGEVTSYFSLRDINDDLQRRNSDLELEIYRLKEQLRLRDESAYRDTMHVDSVLSRYDFIIAHVINNSTSRADNYITINKGRLDGVRPEMGVMDQNGIVGVVNITGDHTARLMSLLNTNFRISCKVKGQDHIGPLMWGGEDPSIAILEELPSHAVFHPGDTIVTSGYSTMFPEGVPVGTVIDGHREHDDNFFALRVKLFTDFTTLSTVRIIDDHLSEELHMVETDPVIKQNH
ncbi:MAG: rod shape-determining protein MreC [Lachnoclostridium sp.]|nr:rod shape-determining protein MreC [Lachnoclostridium sp.]